MAYTKNTWTANSTILSAANFNNMEQGILNAQLYATCSTGASTVAKVASISGVSSLTLSDGLRVSIKFTNANTAASPTLNVAGSGAKNIKIAGTTNAASGAWIAGSVVDFIYDGTYWQMVGSQGNVSHLTYTVVSTF